MGEPECWLEEREECHDVQVKVKHHDHQPKQKWKRSVDGEASEAEDTGLEVEGEGNNDEKEEAAEVSEGEVIQGEAVATDGTNIRKGRSLSLALGAAKLTGAVVGGHFGKKLGLGLASPLGLVQRSTHRRMRTILSTSKRHILHPLSTTSIISRLKKCAEISPSSSAPATRCASRCRGRSAKNCQ